MQVWFSKLATSSIDNFEQLGTSFMHHFIGGQCQKRPVDLLLTIKQAEREPMRSYVKRFTREVLEVDKVDDKVQLTTFKASLKSREFVVALVDAAESLEVHDCRRRPSCNRGRKQA